MSASPPAKALAEESIAASQIPPRKNDFFPAIRDAQLAEGTFDFPAISFEKSGDTPAISAAAAALLFGGRPLRNPVQIRIVGRGSAVRDVGRAAREVQHGA